MAKYKAKGLKVALHVLDNEASAAYRKAITDHKVTFHLVPPHIHRRNKAERAIRTFKEHLKAILAGIDESYPLKHWDVLIPQAEMGLNLMRQSNINPKISAYTYLNGPFDFNATPLAPLGCKVLTHDKPSIRATWDFNASPGWYLSLIHI